MKAEIILMWMLALLPPGRSVYSEVPVHKDEPAPCSEPTILCNPPRWSEIHGEWVRYETPAEGLERYRVIADSIAATAGKDSQLARYLLAVSYHESGWRRDVHSGIGKLARGDDGRSWCLIQRMLGKTSPKGPPLVGLDHASTKRCFEMGAKVLRYARSTCRKGWLAHRPGPECIFAVFGGVWSRNDRRVLARVRTLGRISGSPPKLAHKVRVALGLDQ